MAASISSFGAGSRGDRLYDLDPSISSSANNTFHGNRIGSFSDMHNGSLRSQRAATSKKTRKTPAALDITNMSASTSTSNIPANAQPARLHKRGSSVSSSQNPPSPSPLLTQFATPFATYEEPSQHVSPTSPLGATPKIKPYLRKMSLGREQPKDDQGQIDLSKSTAENERLSGLGIENPRSPSAADVSFTHPPRRGSAHNRTISASSANSNNSAGPHKSSQTFVHPMRQTPRPYTPPVTPSYPSSINDEEADEYGDVLRDEELRPPSGFRNKRSMSLSSTAQNMPTPLSQSYTAADLHLPEMAPSMPGLSSRSQTNLSMKSGLSSSRSSSNLRPSRPRRDTDRSVDTPTVPSSRTSLDKAVSFVAWSTRADSDHRTREERIRAARRKFEEKEAEKDRKLADKQERQRRKSEASDRKTTVRQAPAKTPKGSSKSSKKQQDLDEKHRLRAMSYEEAPSPDFASLPRYGAEAGTSEKTPSNNTSQARRQKTQHNNAQGGWLRFSTWLSTRMMNCGKARKPSAAA